MGAGTSFVNGTRASIVSGGSSAATFVNKNSATLVNGGTIVVPVSVQGPPGPNTVPTDAAIAAAVQNTGGAGPLTSAALSASFADAIATDGTPAADATDERVEVVGDARYAGLAGRYWRQGTSAKIIAKVQAGEGCRLCQVGTSIRAAYDGSGNVYAEASGLGTLSEMSVVGLALACVVDPSFVAPDPAVATVGTSTFPIPYHAVTKSSGTSLTYTVKQITPKRDGTNYTDKLTIYVAQRSSDQAPTFDVVVSGGSTTNVNTYIAPLAYAGSTNIGPRWFAVTVTCPTTESVTFTINNLQVTDHGLGGYTGDGILYFFGATRGPGIHMLNLAVGSTTLLNASTANGTRGVTTDERYDKAQAFAPDWLMDGFVSNDAKTGVWASVDLYKAEYLSRIAAERPGFPADMLWTLSNDPAGLGAPYDGNPAYNQALREVALEAGLDLHDVETLLTDRTDLYADFVHLIALGYVYLGNNLLGILGIRAPFRAAKTLSSDTRFSFGSTAPSGTPSFGTGAVYFRTDSSGQSSVYVYRSLPTAGWHLSSGASRSLSHTLTTGGRTIDRDIQDMEILTLSHVAAGTIAVSNSFLGDELVIEVRQDATGGGTITAWTNVKWAGGVNPTLSAGANAVDVFKLKYNGTNWRELSRSLNQAA